ncbi:MAG TPA: ATP-binding protein [Methylophilaceae bacterium]
MRIAYPSSFLKLLLISLALTMLPLLFAFANAALSLDRLAEQSRNTINKATLVTRSSRVLTEQITIMERSARQHLVFGDPIFLQHMALAHRRFLDSVAELSALPLEQSQDTRLTQILAQEQALYDSVNNDKLTDKDGKIIVDKFIALSASAQVIVDDNNRLIDGESGALVSIAGRAQKMLLWQTLTLIPVALLVTAAITYLLAQPVRRIDLAIRHLGRGEYDKTISIEGPKDLRNLGDRLEWLRSQLLHLEEEKKRFLRHVSHELKTPLTAIREGSELLVDGVGGTLSPQQNEIANIILDNSLRLQRMIENLLNYTELQFKGPQLKLSPVSCKPLIKEALENHALTVHAKEITIIQSIEDVTIEADRKKLLAIIDNLLSNAIKFTPRGGKMEIHLHRTENAIHAAVIDTGPGVPPDDRERVFEPFYSDSTTYDGLVSGSGLGLSIVKEYVVAHGGSISLADTESGAHFQLVLPIVVEVVA